RRRGSACGPPFSYSPLNRIVKGLTTRICGILSWFFVMAKTPHVAVLIETSRAYGRGLLEGVARYVRTQGPWSIYFVPQGLGEPPPTWLRNWQGDGILARIDNRSMARAILATGLPAVDLRGRLANLGLPRVGVDNRAVTRLAFQHLQERGFHHYAFCGLARGE